MRHAFLIAAAGSLLAATTARPDDAPTLPESGRIVFFGDSITQAGGYVLDVELFLLTRFPDRTFEIINHGISSETISGTSEPDHDPRRPDAHDRFTRDVAAWKPDLLVACFGMNDGNYHPPDPERLARYQDGVRRLIDRTRAETDADLLLLTPPPFDPYRRNVSDPKASDYGYKFPAVDYDQTLAGYSEWITSLDEPGVTTIDLHRAMNDHLAARRKGEVSYSFSPDGVHPDATGHWLMAQNLLLGWGVRSEVAVVDIDAESLRSRSGAVADLAQDGQALAFTWTTPLPFAFDKTCDPRSLDQEHVADRLNRHTLRVTGLPAGAHGLHASIEGEAEERQVAVLDAAQWGRGVDLTSLERFPTVELARALRDDLARARREEYDRWRRSGGQDQTPPQVEDFRRRSRPRAVKLRFAPAAPG